MFQLRIVERVKVGPRVETEMLRQVWDEAREQEKTKELGYLEQREKEGRGGDEEIDLSYY